MGAARIRPSNIMTAFSVRHACICLLALTALHGLQLACAAIQPPACGNGSDNNCAELSDSPKLLLKWNVGANDVVSFTVDAEVAQGE